MKNVMVVSYGSRGAVLADALYRSNVEEFSVYVADKQRNPLNAMIAERTGGQHVVVPSLDVESLYRFAEGIPELQFVVVGPEGPIIDGITDRIEDGLNVPVLAQRKQYAIEGSKADQRQLLAEVAPEANPKYWIFPKGAWATDVSKYMRRFGYKVAIKPDKATAGKGVVVHGDHFNTPDEAIEMFHERNKDGPVIVEELLEGEESSFTAYSDGMHLVPLRETRDYKRAFDGDKGPNTGGMGAYADSVDILPFMTEADRAKEEEIVQRVFEQMRGGKYNSGIRGVFYVAFMHTKDGPKILEINSREGDPEGPTIHPTLDTDFGEVCLEMLGGTLGEIRSKPIAAVTTCLVPPTYGGKDPDWNGNSEINLEPLGEAMFDPIEDRRIYPGSMSLGDDGKLYMVGSRTLEIVGLGPTIPEARRKSLEFADEVIKDNPDLWRRTDIASEEHIAASVEHMRKLRGG